MISKIFTFFKKYWLFIFLATIAGSLIILKLLVGKPATEPPTSASPTPAPTLAAPDLGGQPLPTDTIVNLTDTDLPSDLLVYRGTNKSLSLDQANQTAAELGFSTEPTISQDVLLGDFYTWSLEDRYLTVNPAHNHLEYGLDLYQNTVTPGAPSLDEAQDALESLLKRLELWPDMPVRWQKAVYLNRDTYFTPVDQPTDADFIRVGFNPALDKYSLVGADPTIPLVYAIYGQDLELIKLDYRFSYSDFEKTGEFPLKTETEIKENIVLEGRVVHYEKEDSNLIPPKLTKTAMNTVTLAYYQDLSAPDQVQPVLILSGEATTVEDETIPVIVYLPAVTSTILRNSRNHFNIEPPPLNPLGL